MASIKVFIVFLIHIVFFTPKAHAIEVIIGGKTYASMEEYKLSQKSSSKAVVQSEPPMDPATEQALKKLSSQSSEEKVSKITANFEQNWDNPSPKFKVETEQLAQRLEAIADDREEPVMVVSENGKLQVMLLDEQKRKAIEEDIDATWPKEEGGHSFP